MRSVSALSAARSLLGVPKSRNIQKYAYDAYGSLISHDRLSGSIDQPYQYVGRLGYYTHWQEPDFGVLQLGVRFYDPEVGRFGQMDLVWQAAGSYCYAGNQPLDAIDPDGRKVIKLCYAADNTKGSHSWLCLNGDSDCWGLHPAGDKKRPIGPEEIVVDDHYMGLPDRKPTCFIAVVSDCVFDCIQNAIDADRDSPPFFNVSGRFGWNCRQWVGSLFLACGYPANASTVSSVPSTIGQLADYVNSGAASNAADRSCECRRRRGGR